MRVGQISSDTGGIGPPHSESVTANAIDPGHACRPVHMLGADLAVSGTRKKPPCRLSSFGVAPTDKVYHEIST